LISATVFCKIEALGGAMQRFVALGVFIAATGSARAETPTVQGVHERAVTDALSRTLDALGVSAKGTVEIRAASANVVRYEIEIVREGAAVFHRVGVTTPDEVVADVTRTVLLGALARDPERHPRAVLWIDADHAAKPSAAVTAVWRQALASRGFIVVPEREVSLARTTIKSGELEPALAAALGARVVSIELRTRGNDVAVQTTVFDEGPRRGLLATVAPADLADEVTLLIDGTPMRPKVVR
jgi:hypothetical protein